jgi:hypothetical protein
VPQCILQRTSAADIDRACDARVQLRASEPCIHLYFEELAMKKALLLAVALAAIAPTSALAQKACLRVGYIRNWDAPNDKTIIVEDDWYKKFRLSLMGACHAIKFDRHLAFKAIGGSDLSCVGIGDQVISNEFGAGPERCAVMRIEAYTPEMEKADHAAAQAAKDQRNGY